MAPGRGSMLRGPVTKGGGRREGERGLDLSPITPSHGHDAPAWTTAYSVAATPLVRPRSQHGTSSVQHESSGGPVTRRRVPGVACGLRDGFRLASWPQDRALQPGAACAPGRLPPWALFAQWPAQAGTATCRGAQTLVHSCALSLEWVPVGTCDPVTGFECRLSPVTSVFVPAPRAHGDALFKFGFAR